MKVNISRAKRGVNRTYQTELDADEQSKRRRAQIIDRASDGDGTDIRPEGISPFIDRATVCFTAPGHDLVRWLSRRVKLREHHIPNPHERCLTLAQPTREVFEHLARHGARLTGAEPALDLMIPDKDERDRARRIVRTYKRQRYLRGQGEIICGNTSYSGPRGRRQNLANYSDRKSKVTDEPALHLEMRLRGRALARNGITMDTIATFDHQAFWKKYLLLVKIVNPQRLGRLINNQTRGQRRRTSDIRRIKLPSGKEFKYDRDTRTGMTLIRGYKTQAVIDFCRKRGIDIRQHMVSIEVSHLLPERTARETAKERVELKTEWQYKP